MDRCCSDDMGPFYCAKVPCGSVVYNRRMREAPWLVYEAIHELSRRIKSDWRAFEYGSGRSTLYFARRCAQLISVEHDPRWYVHVRGELERSGLEHCTILLHLPERTTDRTADPSDPAAYVSGKLGYARCSFERYVQAIDSCSDESLDLVVVDGRSRPACLLHAAPKLRPGGLLVLDDAQRDRYGRARRILDGSGWDRQVFRGPRDFFPLPTETCIWTRRGG